MENTTHVRTSKRIYYGAMILSILFVLFETFRNNTSLAATSFSTLGIIAFSVVLYSVYKIFYGEGKIILSASEFKVHGYNWTYWEELTSVYPFVEHDLENGERKYIHFRLTDGIDLKVRSEYLELSFEQIVELVNEYKTRHLSKKH